MGAVRVVDQRVPQREVLDEAERILRAEGVLVMPTDSVYGIGCAALPGNPAHERVFAIKHRDRSQTLPWLVADVSDLPRYARDVPTWADELSRRWWPGALTLVVQAGEAVPPEYRGADGTIALRVPDSSLVRELARRVGPLAVTSANVHGKAAPARGADIEPCLVAKADLTLDSGPAPVAIPSTIVGVDTEGPRILREGALPVAALLSQGFGEVGSHRNDDERA